MLQQLHQVVVIKNYNDTARFGDFSYGMYLFAFPIQQIIVMYSGKDIPLISHFLLSVVCTLPFAVISWHLVEKPALSLKQKRRAILQNTTAGMQPADLSP